MLETDGLKVSLDYPYIMHPFAQLSLRHQLSLIFDESVRRPSVSRIKFRILAKKADPAFCLSQ